MNDYYDKNRIYAAIDLKSFFASVECADRGLDPLGVNLVVADSSRTEKTICLAISPSLKAYGLPGRARLFEVVQKIKEENAKRARNADTGKLVEKSYFDADLKKNKNLEIGYIVAPPRMKKYVDTSARIYDIYKRFVSSDDISVYSIDEVFIDLTDYVKLYGLSPRKLVEKMIREVFKETGITATAGIGTNLYLAKIAMDIVAKKMKPNKNGARIAFLDVKSYREQLWDHRPITDFWRVGKGYSERLKKAGILTMGDVAKCSIGKPSDFYNESLLYKIFGVNAELLIDHAWGYEPCTIKDIKAYKPINRSISTGQVLQCPYDFNKSKLIVKEMADSLSLELFDKNLATDKITLAVSYDAENLKDPNFIYDGEIKIDRYGRSVPKEATGSENIGFFTSSTKILVDAFSGLFERIADKELLVGKINVCAANVADEDDKRVSPDAVQTSFFDDDADKKKKEEDLKKEKKGQAALIAIRKKYGKNAILKGMNFEEGATAKTRNKQIGGHKE